MTDLLFIALYAIIIALVIESAVILFRITGLQRTVARYQVISMLTGTGFTTEESSLVIDHPIRRKISAMLILFGYFSLAVMISSIASLLKQEIRINVLGVTIAILVAVFFVLRNKLVTAILQRKFNTEMSRQFNLEDWPLKKALALKDGDAVMMVNIKEGSKYEGYPCKKLIQGDQDMNLLLIKRGEAVLRASLWEEELQAGDRVMVFGNEDALEKKFGGSLSEHLE